MFIMPDTIFCLLLWIFDYWYLGFIFIFLLIYSAPDFFVGSSACGHAACQTISIITSRKAGWYTSDILLHYGKTRRVTTSTAARKRAKKVSRRRDTNKATEYADINKILQVFEIGVIYLYM